MNESQTRLLIQRELDGNLSHDEENRLRRVLMVNDSAVSFRANLSQVVAAAKDLELPEFVRPGDSSRLAGEIIESLPVAKGNFWDPLLDIFANRKSAGSDPRLTRNLGSIGTTANSLSQSGATTNGTSASHPKIDPAVLHPQTASDKEKTPYGLQSVEQSNQFITGTHSTLGGLAKKLGKNINNSPVEDVGKTLADAIREKVHETLREETAHDVPPECGQEIEQEFKRVDVPVQNPKISESIIGIAAVTPEIATAVITTEEPAASVILGTSMVLTVGTQGITQPPAQSFKAPEQENSLAHGFSTAELEWKSGTYPTVQPPVKPAQTETGPLVPFSLDQWSSPLPFSDPVSNPVSTNDFWSPAPIAPEIAWAPPPRPDVPKAAAPWAPHPVAPSQTAVSQTEPVLPNDANAYYEPKIVPVRRNALPIEEISERINLIFNEQVESSPPTKPWQEIREKDALQQLQQKTGPMDSDVNACLSSVGRLADIRYATNSPGNINNLGKFLLTDDAVASIETCISNGQGQSHARVITLDAAMQLEAALEPIVRTPGVAGYMVLGYDGFVIGNKLSADIDVELLAGCALVTYMNSHSIMKVMGYTKLRQMVCKNSAGNMILADFGKGFLVTLTGETDAALLASLCQTIEAICCD